jgi:2,3,4,5-tetrahydropyridine-2-carboxylate N-succinyltransferase
MTNPDLQTTIEALWSTRETLSGATQGAPREAVDAALALLDTGEARVAAPTPDGWFVHEWLKKAVLLSFRLNDSTPMPGAAGAPVFDKVAIKFENWDASHFATAGFRAVPGAIVRHGAFVGRGAVLMPSFVNIGAYVGEGTMIDTWATVGSCAHVGRDCHISGGAGLGGVLEPLQEAPTIIEDGCFIGARSEVAEGVIVGEGSVLSMGVFLTASTKIVDRKTGETFRGRVPPYSVVVPGALPDPYGVGPSLSCAVIVKTVDAQTRSKTSINELLRD